MSMSCRFHFLPSDPSYILMSGPGYTDYDDDDVNINSKREVYRERGERIMSRLVHIMINDK